MTASASEELRRCGQQRKVNELGHGQQATHGQTAGTDNCGAQQVELSNALTMEQKVLP